MDKNIICFLGMKTCGKDYNAEAFINSGYKKIAFADPLRDIVWKILGYTPDKKDTISYTDFKNCVLTTEKKCKIFNIIPWYKDFVVTTIRKILQNTGSVFKELFGETYWANLWYKEVLNSEINNIVCTDARFTYELKKILSLSKRGYKITFVWCQHEGADYINILKDNHESEELSQFMYNNRKQYGLYDGCVLKEHIIKKIIKDFEKHKKISNL